MRVVSHGLRRPPARTVLVVALFDARHASLAPKRASQDVFGLADAALFFESDALRAASSRTLILLASFDYAHCRLGAYTDSGEAVPCYEHVVYFPARPAHTTERGRRCRGRRG